MAWTSLSFSYGSVLTSTKMTQIYDNMTAICPLAASGTFGTLLKYTLITASDAAWAKQTSTTYIVFQMAAGAGGGGGGSNGANPAWSGTDGGVGGTTSFGSLYSIAGVGYGSGGIYSGANGYHVGYYDVSAGVIPYVFPTGTGVSLGVTDGAAGAGVKSKFGAAGVPGGGAPAIGAGASGGATAGNGGGSGGGTGASPITPLYVITSPSATYNLTIGAGGAAGTNPNGGTTPTVGGGGFIEIWEYA